MVRHLAWIGIVVTAMTALGDDWPQWRGPNRDGIWRETGIVDELPSELNYKWRTPVGQGYAGPCVAGDRVYLMDRLLPDGVENPANPFDKSSVTGYERVLCFDLHTGKILWEHKYECPYTISYPYGPRVTPSVVDGKLYTVGAMGHFWCLDAATGKVIWSKKYVEDFGTEINTWGMSAHPLVDGNKVILLVAGNAGVVALDKETGKEIWRALKFVDPGYCPPVIVEAGGTRQLIIWTPDAVQSLNPEDGKTYWSQPFKLSNGLSISQPIFDAKNSLLFITAFYQGPLMLKLGETSPTAEILWKGKSSSEIKTDGLHSIMSTPIFQDGHIYGICSFGQLRCIKEDTGERVWETFKATGEGRWWNAFLIQHEGRTIIANEQGELIFARLAPDGYHESSRASLIEPTIPVQRRKVVWSHPAFAHRSVFARNDKEIVCVDLTKKAP